SSGEEAIQYVKENDVDIILLDIQLKGKYDGIETASQLQTISKAPVIYLTANSDEATFNRAKSTKPAAFISKPFKPLDLQRAIELTICRMVENKPSAILPSQNEGEQQFILEDRIFIKNRERMLKIMLSDIMFIEADRNYSRIFTQKKEFLLSISLKTMEEKLPETLFVRVHRSYVINLTQIEEVGDSYVVVADKSIPMSAGLKDNLLKRLQTI
ncbi:MAG: response regulator transcription factor, partial [Niabella sp.]